MLVLGPVSINEIRILQEVWWSTISCRCIIKRLKYIVIVL